MTFVTTLVVIGAVAFVIVVILKKEKFSFCLSPQAKADKPANACLARPAIAEANMKLS